MFGFFKSPPAVEEKGNKVHITGINTQNLIEDIERIWGTNKIRDHFFHYLSSKKMIIYSYLVPDMIYILGKILERRGSRWKSLREAGQIRELLLQNTRFATIAQDVQTSIDYSRVKDLLLTPLDFQETFLKTYDINKYKYHLNGYLLAATAGSGKTYTALCLYHLLVKKKKCVIICPKNAVLNVWKKHVDEKVFKDKRTVSTSLDLSMNHDAEFIVLHYEAFIKYYQEGGFKNYKPDETMVILDESHNLNELSSNRTQVYVEFCQKGRFQDILHLSGTPIKAVPAEAIPLFKAIDPLFTDEVMDSFKKIYRQNNNRGTDILQNRIGLVSYKVEKKQLGLKEPIFEKISIEIPNGHEFTLTAIRDRMVEFSKRRLTEINAIKKENDKLYLKGLDTYYQSLGFMSSDEKKRYNDFRDDLDTVVKANGAIMMIGKEVMAVNAYENKVIYPYLFQRDKEFAKEWRETRTIYKYPKMKIQGECLGQVVGGARIACAVSMIPHIDFIGICNSTEKKTVVFTSFTEAIEKCIETFPDMNLEGAFVYAKTNHMLNKIVKDFNSDPDLNPLVATYKSLSTAVPLTMADTMILIDFPFRDYILQQTVSRIHRLDSDTQTTVYSFELVTGSEPNISNRSREILQWSQAQVKDILGIQSPFEVEDLETASLAIEGYLDDTDILRDKPMGTSW